MLMRKLLKKNLNNIILRGQGSFCSYQLAETGPLSKEIVIKQAMKMMIKEIRRLSLLTPSWKDVKTLNIT